MKKLVLLLNLLLILSIASAVEIQLSKDSYDSSETLQAEILGNFLDNIREESIHFYRERNIPVDYDLLKLEDKYLLYALLPSKEGNYSLKIKNVRYVTETGTSSEDVVKEFTIKKSNTTSLSVNPGFIFTDEDFYIIVKANKNIEIETEFLGDAQSYSLVQNREEKIHFSVEDVVNYTETSLRIQDYQIPAIIFVEKPLNITEISKFRFTPSEINAVILKKETHLLQVSLINLGRRNITNINLSPNISDSDLKVTVFPSSIEVLEAGDIKFVNISFSSEKVKNFTGEIVASSDNATAELAYDIKITTNKSEVNTSIDPPVKAKSCDELNGTICAADEICDGTTIFIQNDYCCTGECTGDNGGGGGSSWIYGIIIVVVVILGIVGFSIYAKKRQKPLNVLKKRQENFEGRMSGKEVKGGLTKS